MRPDECLPGEYVKGETTRTALTRADAVALRFEGFKPRETTPVDEPTEPVVPADPEENE